jgi:hypothetical protein
MSPTVFREGPYRFYFFSREEPRIHVHVGSSEGEAKFWIEPEVGLAENHGLPTHELKSIQKMVESHEQQIRTAWQLHFGN